MVDGRPLHFNKLEFKYTDGLSVTGVTPSAISVAGGTLVSVAGAGFGELGKMGCMFGTMQQQSAGTVVSSSLLLCETPSLARTMASACSAAPSQPRVSAHAPYASPLETRGPAECAQCTACGNGGRGGRRGGRGQGLIPPCSAAAPPPGCTGLGFRVWGLGSSTRPHRYATKGSGLRFRV